MKLQPDRIDTLSINAYGPGWVAVQGQKITHSVLISSQGLNTPWGAANFDSLTPDHFAALADLDVELVIFGSGARLIFPASSALRPLYEARVGIETMDTQAACRTFNILMAEDRRVIAAILAI